MTFGLNPPFPLELVCAGKTDLWLVGRAGDADLALTVTGFVFEFPETTHETVSILDKTEQTSCLFSY